MAIIHSRSNSFPARENPFVLEIEEQLRRVSSSKAVSSSEICDRLSGLKDLQDGVDKLLLSPQTQQMFSQAENKRMIGEVTDASLRLLDLCCTVQEALAQTKDSARDLMSTIRRKTGIQETMVENYYASRKAVKKLIKKATENLKTMQTNNLHSSALVKDQESLTIITVLKQIETVTLSALESLLSFLSGSKTRTSWSLVSRLVKARRVGCEGGEENLNEIEKVDAAIRIRSKSADLQTELKDLDLCIQDLEENIESLYRRLIKTRVSLLNILNQ